MKFLLLIEAELFVGLGSDEVAWLYPENMEASGHTDPGD